MTAARTAGADAAEIRAGKPVGTDAAVGVVGGADAAAVEIGRLLERCAFPDCISASAVEASSEL